MTDSLVIFLHGVGSGGADLAPLGRRWAEILPQTSFAAPDGSFPFDQGGSGRQWFSVSGVTAANRGERIVAARPALDAVLAGLIADHGLSDRLDRVALVGFSQGAIMALDVVVSGRLRIGAVVGFAGRLASPQPWSSSATPVLLVHGSDDAMIPAVEGEAAATALGQAGVPVQWQLIPQGRHEIPPAGAAAAGEFLARQFNARTAGAVALPREEQ